VNGHKVIELTCAEVVPLIAQSGPRLDLVVSRRPADTEVADYATVTGGNVASTAAPRQVHVVVDEPAGGGGHSLDRRKLKEDDV